MKFKKIILTAVVSVASAAMLAVTAFAATGINSDEQKLLDRLQTSVTTKAGVTLKIPSDYIAQAKSYLSQPDVDLPSADVNKMMPQIDEAIKTVKNSNATSLKEFSKSDKNALIANASAAANVCGLKLSYDNSSKVISLTDSDGKTVFKSGNIIKVTGGIADQTNYTLLFTLLAAGAAAGAVSLVLLKKRMGENA